MAGNPPRPKLPRLDQFRFDSLVCTERLSPRRLVQIWLQLPEHERFPFILSLEADLADQVIDLTAPEPLKRLRREAQNG